MEIVLPMMQYLIWMSAIAGLMVFAVEAVVGGAFWAFSHVRADGGELVNQQQAYGYSILMNAIFRPLLTVVGLLFSSVIMAVMAQFVDETFALAYENSGIGTLIDPFAILTVFFLLFYVHYQVAIRSLRTITLLPDAILKWIGSGQSATSYGELIGGETGNEFGAVFRTTGQNNIMGQAALQQKAAQTRGRQPTGDDKQEAKPEGKTGGNTDGSTGNRPEP
jgi:hypothetical protein